MGFGYFDVVGWQVGAINGDGEAAFAAVFGLVSGRNFNLVGTCLTVVWSLPNLTLDSIVDGIYARK